MYDELTHVSGEQAVQCAQQLAAQEGIFTGTSGGGVVACALERAKAMPRGSSVLAMLPDTGERYLSTPLFDDVPADMTSEERGARHPGGSNPDRRPDRAPRPPCHSPSTHDRSLGPLGCAAYLDSVPATTAFPQPLPEPTDAGRATVAGFVQSAPVAVVAMESCEFCWTIFKLLKAIGVEYQALNFDALEYAPNNQGNVIRASVQEHTGAVTFPQVFVGGKFIGGAADACIMWKKGELQPVLEAAGAKPAGEPAWNGYAGDPFEFLPKWMSQNPLRTK